MSPWLKARSLFLFFPLAYLLSWLLWLPQVAAAQGLTETPASPYWHLIGGIGPMVAAFLMTWLTAGQAGVNERIGRIGKWRVGSQWHLFAWFAPVVIFLFAALIIRIVWGAWPNIRQFGRTSEYPELPMLVYWLANLFFYGFGEEVGWRGFALPRLQKRFSALFATALLSLFWTACHLPLFWFVPGYMAMGWGEIAGLSLSFFLSVAIFTWLYNSTAGSILIVAIFHGTADIAFTTPSPGNLDVVVGMLMTLLGLVILLTHKPSTLSRSEKQII
jgi:membrane protease YdiL (CAAX protease family)